MKVVSFGELLLRLASPGYSRLFQRDSLESTFCGGEANVAVSLSNFGWESCFVTKVPNNDIGQSALNSLRYFGVDTSKSILGEGRMGLYYLEKGCSQRSSKVIYDRKYSSISQAQNHDFNWSDIFEGVDWFHWTGINPALSENMFEITLEACQEAKKRSIIISCDLNYRSKLWTPAEAKNKMEKLLAFVDVCICNEEDAEKVLNIKAEDTNVSEAKLNKRGYIDVAQTISNRFGCQYIAITLRESYSASMNGWSAMLYNAKHNTSYFSKKYDIQIVDRVGGGDSFAASIIYALGEKMKEDQAIEFAVASSCLKHTIEGDFNRITLDEVYNLVDSGGSGRVQR